jgi:hypothetical protein
MSQIIGIGFPLFIFEGKIPKLFTIRELEDKPHYHKRAGMISFPLETFKPEDKDLNGTILRLFDEEMGISPEQIKILRLVQNEFNPIPGRKDISIFYGYGTFSGDPNQKFLPKDNDIEFAGWQTIPQLLASFIRVEVSPILAHLMLNGLYDELITNNL